MNKICIDLFLGGNYQRSPMGRSFGECKGSGRNLHLAIAHKISP